jgi:hypothetical protein
MSAALDHVANQYIAVTLTPAVDPGQLAARCHPTLNHVGNVGQLADVQLFSIPKAEWGRDQDKVLASLKAQEGVTGVNVQDPPRQRVKRGGDEF